MMNLITILLAIVNLWFFDVCVRSAGAVLRLGLDLSSLFGCKQCRCTNPVCTLKNQRLPDVSQNPFHWRSSSTKTPWTRHQLQSALVLWQPWNENSCHRRWQIETSSHTHLWVAIESCCDPPQNVDQFPRRSYQYGEGTGIRTPFPTSFWSCWPVSAEMSQHPWLECRWTCLHSRTVSAAIDDHNSCIVSCRWSFSSS